MPDPRPNLGCAHVLTPPILPVIKHDLLKHIRAGVFEYAEEYSQPANRLTLAFLERVAATPASEEEYVGWLRDTYLKPLHTCAEVRGYVSDLRAIFEAVRSIIRSPDVSMLGRALGEHADFITKAHLLQDHGRHAIDAHFMDLNINPSDPRVN